MLKLKAEMMREEESALERVCGCVREYREEVGVALPPCHQLETTHHDIIERQVSQNFL